MSNVIHMVDYLERKLEEKLESLPPDDRQGFCDDWLNEFDRQKSEINAAMEKLDLDLANEKAAEADATIDKMLYDLETLMGRPHE